MTKEKGRPTKKNSGLSERLTALLSRLGISQKDAAAMAISANGKPTRLSVFHGWLHGTNCTDPIALQNLCRALSARGQENISFEWLLTGTQSPQSGPTIHQPEDIARLFLKEDELFDGYIHLKASRVTMKKKPEGGGK